MGSSETSDSHVEFVPIHAVFDIVSGETSRSRETVLGAVQRRTGEHVGIRRPSLEFSTDADALRRTIALNHPNILCVRTALRDKEGIYFVTEWAEGGSLARRLGDGPLDGARLADAALQIGRGLTYLHRAGAAPVDLGLDQILEDENGTFKLGGFGLPEESGEETSVPGAGGSEAHRQRVRSDLRAYGRTIERLAGGAALPAGLAEIVRRCLADDPAEGFAETGALLEALERELAGAASSASGAASSARPAADASHGTVPGVFPRLRTKEMYEEQGEPMRGGMGSVRMAIERATGRRVAIKRLLPEASRDEEGMQRFLREASSIAGLDHPHILKLLQPGRDEHGDFLVLEWAAGGSLREKLERDGPLPVEEVVEVARKIGRALAFAHSKGVIHRDIKPHNILLTETGEPKLADFGLARSVGDHTLSSSRAGGGSPLYMPPEQHDHSRRADERSDLYSLGKTLYHLATGLSPTSPQAKNVPPRLRRAIMRCVEEDASRRPASAQEFLRDLERSPAPARFAALLLLAFAAAAVATWFLREDRPPDPSDPSDPARTPSQVAKPATVAPLPSVVLAGFFGADDEPLAGGAEVEADAVEIRLDLANLSPEAREALEIEVLRGGEPLAEGAFTSTWDGERLVLGVPIEGRTNRLQVRVPELGFASDVLELKRATPRPSVVSVADARRGVAGDGWLTGRAAAEVEVEVATAGGVDRLWLGRGSDRREVPVDGGAAATTVELEEGENAFRWYWPTEDEPIGEGSFTIVADLTPPAVSLSEPRAWTVTRADELSLRGRVEDAHVGDEVEWRLLRDGVEVGAGRPHTEANGSFRDRVGLDGAGDGAFVIEVAAVDRAGHRSEPATVELRVDRRPPALEAPGALAFEPVLGAGRRLQAVHLSGRADEELSRVEVDGRAAVVEGRRFEARDLPARAGDGAYRIVLVDAAGNASPEITSGHGIDVTPPTATLAFVDRGGVAHLRVTPSEPLSRLTVAGTSHGAAGGGPVEVSVGRSLAELTAWKSGPGPTHSPIEIAFADAAGNETALSVVCCPVDSSSAVRCRLGPGGKVEGTEPCPTCGGEYCPRTGDRGRKTREDGQVHAHPLHRMPSGEWVELDCWMLDPQCRYCGWARPR
ncbi:MAG: serine/threonine-protein kinase [Planctomycetota bacterium JB042]